MKFLLRILVALSVFFISLNVVAQIQSPYKTQAAKSKQLIVETVYKFDLFDYERAATVSIGTLVVNEKALTPEDAIARLVKAFVSKDYARMRTSWTNDSLRLMDGVDKKFGIDSLVRFKQIADTYKGTDINFNTKIVFDKYILIEFNLKDLEKTILRDTMVAVLENNEWKITQELAGNPIVSNWNAQTGRVRLPFTRTFTEITGRN